MRISDWILDVCAPDLQDPSFTIPLSRFWGNGESEGNAQGDGPLQLQGNGSQVAADLGAAALLRGRRGFGAAEILRPRDVSLSLGPHPYGPRSEARRVGKEGVSTCRSRW